MIGSTVIILGGMATWGVLHSLTAALWAKARARRWLGQKTADGVYRLVYNAFAGITFLPVFALPTLLPDQAIYELPRWALFVTVPLQLASLFGLTYSLWKVDLPRFLGLRQLGRWLGGDAEPRDRPRFVASGVYRRVRHPLYFFSLVFLWLNPVMTANSLTFNAGVTLYFWIGSVFEERKLVLEFGDAYREYQRRVPRLFPIPRPGR